MKRSAALTPLSRGHHVALVVARALRRASDEDGQAVAGRFTEFLTAHELGHFAVEETVLLPAVPEDEPGQAMVQQVRSDHEHLRDALRRLQNSEQAATVPFLHALGRRLGAHVLLEERELFPYLERSLGETALAQLGVRLARALGDEPAEDSPQNPGLASESAQAI